MEMGGGGIKTRHHKHAGLANRLKLRPTLSIFWVTNWPQVTNKLLEHWHQNIIGPQGCKLASQIWWYPFYLPWPQGLQIGFPNLLVSFFSLGATTRPLRPKPKLSMRRGGPWAWVHVVWTCGAKVLEYWMIFSLRIKLNRNWKFRRNGMRLWYC
jgi:hypothetical protein